MYVNKNIYGYETVKIRHCSQGKRENMGKCQPEMIKIGASPNKWRIWATKLRSYSNLCHVYWDIWENLLETLPLSNKVMGVGYHGMQWVCPNLGHGPMEKFTGKLMVFFSMIWTGMNIHKSQAPKWYGPGMGISHDENRSASGAKIRLSYLSWLILISPSLKKNSL